MLESLDNSQRRARQDRLLSVGGRVEEADVVVHIEEVGVAEALDILGEGDRLLDVAVLLLVVAPDGVVNKDAVHGIVFVGGYYGLFKAFLIDLAKVKVETAAERGKVVRVVHGIQRRDTGSDAHFSSHVFLDHSAYCPAAGSSLARKATKVGLPVSGLWMLANVSLTSARSFLAIVSARMTLQALGTCCDSMAWKWCYGHVSYPSCVRPRPVFPRSVLGQE